MKRKLTGIALAAALGLMGAAAPASAGEQMPLNGDMELALFGTPCPEPDQPPFLTWAGTVVLDGATYGIAFFPTSPPPGPEKFFYFSEYWTVFTLDGSVVTPAVACDADRVVLDGFDEGRQGPGGTAKADGTVETADSSGPLAGVAPESRTFWRGRVTNDTGTAFTAKFHIRAPK